MSFFEYPGVMYFIIILLLRCPVFCHSIYTPVVLGWVGLGWDGLGWVELGGVGVVEVVVVVVEIVEVVVVVLVVVLGLGGCALGWLRATLPRGN